MDIFKKIKRKKIPKNRNFAQRLNFNLNYGGIR